MGKNILQESINQNEEKTEKSQDAAWFNEEEYNSGLSEVEEKRKEDEYENKWKIKELEEKLVEDNGDRLLKNIDWKVFENVVNQEELKDICKKSMKKWMLEIDKNGKIIWAFVEVWWEKRKSILFNSLLDAWYSPEQALKSRLQVRTESFKNWFGDWENNPSQASKIVDKNGEPLVMWHWTISNFNEFKHWASKNYDGVWNTDWRYYFAESKNFVKQYTLLKKKTVIETLYNVKNMLFWWMSNVSWDEVVHAYNDIIEDMDKNIDNFEVDDYGTVLYKWKDFITWRVSYSDETTVYNRFHTLCEWDDVLEFSDFKKWTLNFKDKTSKQVQLKDIYLPKTWVDWIFIPCFIKWDSISSYIKWKDWLDMDRWFDYAIEHSNKDTDIILYDDKWQDWIKIWVMDAVQIKSVINNDWTFSNEEWKFNDYFWKKVKLTTWIDSKVVYENQSKINTILSSNKTREEKKQELWEYVSEQYFNMVWEKIVLTKFQVETIIKSYEVKWIVWRLSLAELKQKNKILSETIKDSNIRRILLECGLC